MRPLKWTAHIGGCVPVSWLVAAQLAAAPAAALQILQAADHAELTAEVSSSEVNRIALEGDRIARVVQSAGAYTLEHDPVRGDLYLYPGGPGRAGLSVSLRTPGAPESSRAQTPVTLYLGTENGLTYRLTLMPAERDSAQILIRTVSAPEPDGNMAPGIGHKSAIVALIGAVARRDPLPGYAVVPAANVPERDAKDMEWAPTAGDLNSGIRLIETWRGPRLTARVLEVARNGPRDASELAAVGGSGAIAAWLSGAGAAHVSPAHGSPADGNPVDGGAAHGNPAHGRPSEDRFAGRSVRLAVVVEATGYSGEAP